MIRSAPFLILLAMVAPACGRAQNDEASTGKAPLSRGVEVEVAGTRAYLSLPEKARPPIPGLVVVHEWWGLNDHIRHWADRLASEGYAALAVDLYGGRAADDPDSARALSGSVDETRALQILRAAYDTLGSDPRIKATKRGSIGWCFGGGWSLRTALDIGTLDAAVIYYGRLVTDPSAYQGMRTPILGIFGNRDPSITPEIVNQFEKALDQAGVPHEIYRFDASHAFANPSGANYNERAAAEAWEKTRAFLAKHLKQG
jgi:carboxymethylenebutenolidase